MNAGYSNIKPLKPGEGGRPKGAVNKTTKERNQMIRKMILESAVIGNALDLLKHRIINEPETVRTADVIKAFSVLVPYIAQTANEEKLEETIGETMSREQIQNNIISLIQKKAANQ